MSHGKFFEVEPNVDIYYEDRGIGTPIIFVPGLSFSSEMFEHQIDYFSQNYRVIAIDPRSQGHSTITLQGNNYDTHAKDLVKLIKYLELKDIILVGWSTGTLETLGYIEQEGTMNVKGLFNIDMSPRPMSENQHDWVEGSLDEVGGLYTLFYSPDGQKEFVKMYATEVMVQRNLTEVELFELTKQSLHTPYYIVALLLASACFSNKLETAITASEEIPTFMLIAEHWADVAVPFMNKNCPKTQVGVLGGHMMFWEYPEKFNAILDEFISSIK